MATRFALLNDRELDTMTAFLEPVERDEPPDDTDALVAKLYEEARAEQIHRAVNR